MPTRPENGEGCYSQDTRRGRATEPARSAGVLVTACRDGFVCNTGSPPRLGSNPSRARRSAVSRGMAEGLAVPERLWKHGGGKGPWFRALSKRGGAGPIDESLPAQFTLRTCGESYGGRPKTARSAHRLNVTPRTPDPRAGCGKAARPVRRGGEGNVRVRLARRGAPSLYSTSGVERESIDPRRGGRPATPRSGRSATGPCGHPPSVGKASRCRFP